MKIDACDEFWSFTHNVIAHPLSQLFRMGGWAFPILREWSELVHDLTVPDCDLDGHR